MWCYLYSQLLDDKAYWRGEQWRDDRGIVIELIKWFCEVKNTECKILAYKG
jgi:hypothetical protein